MRYNNIWITSIFLIVFAAFLKAGFPVIPQIDNDDFQIGQISRPFVETSDPELIRFFLDEFLIPEDSVTRMEIIDITANGFGPDDIIVTHPSMRVYVVEDPSQAALSVMRDWSYDDYRVDADNMDPAFFDPEETGISEDAAQKAIIADLLRTINRNYAYLPIRLRFERDEDGFTFEMWDFDEAGMHYQPGPPPVPDSVLTYDLLYISQSDTVYVTDRDLYDVIYLTKTVRDTVFLPESARRE